MNEIPPIHAEALAGSPLIVSLILIFWGLNIIAWRPEGIMIQHWHWLFTSRQVRTFEALAPFFHLIRPLLLVQLFLFSGLIFYYWLSFASGSSVLPSQQSFPAWLLPTVCIVGPLLLHVLQFLTYNWFCYLFDERDNHIIFNRIYVSIIMLCAPVALLIFTFLTTGLISTLTGVYLCIGVFILAQILFIFSGFKIFFRGFGSFCFIILYLCALEIAPVAVLLAKILR